MLIIKFDKPPTIIHKFLLPYLYKFDSGLYVGDVTKKVYLTILDKITMNIGNGSATVIWSNGLSPTGFDVERVGGSKLTNMDGIWFYSN